MLEKTLKRLQFLLEAPKPVSYQEQHCADLLQWDPHLDLAAVLTMPLWQPLGKEGNITILP